MAKALGITFGLLLAVIAFVFFRTGYFKDVAISTAQEGPFILVYQVHKGPYHKIIPVIESVEKYFADKGMACPLAFGLYLHNPDAVEHDRLVSHGGCAFPLTQTEGNVEWNALVKESGFQTETLDRKEYVQAAFSGSPSLGPLKVYPAVEKWLSKYGYKKVGPVLELYQTLGPDAVTTRYLFTYE